MTLDDIEWINKKDAILGKYNNVKAACIYRGDGFSISIEKAKRLVFDRIKEFIEGRE